MRQKAFCFDIFHQITSLVSFAQSLKPFVNLPDVVIFFSPFLATKHTQVNPRMLNYTGKKNVSFR